MDPMTSTAGMNSMTNRRAWDRKMEVTSMNGTASDCAAPIRAKAAIICPVLSQRSPSTAESVFGPTRRQIDGQIREMLEIPLGDRLSAGLKFVDPLQLRQSNGCGEIGQIVFEAGSDNVIRPTRPEAAESVKGVTIETVSTHRSSPRRHYGVPRRDHSALAGGDRLIGVKAKDARIRVRSAD